MSSNTQLSSVNKIRYWQIWHSNVSKTVSTDTTTTLHLSATLWKWDVQWHQGATMRGACQILTTRQAKPGDGETCNGTQPLHMPTWPPLESSPTTNSPSKNTSSTHVTGIYSKLFPLLSRDRQLSEKVNNIQTITSPHPSLCRYNLGARIRNTQSTTGSTTTPYHSHLRWCPKVRPQHHNSSRPSNSHNQRTHQPTQNQARWANATTWQPAIPTSLQLPPRCPSRTKTPDNDVNL